MLNAIIRDLVFCCSILLPYTSGCYTWWCCGVTWFCSYQPIQQPNQQSIQQPAQNPWPYPTPQAPFQGWPFQQPPAWPPQTQQPTQQQQVVNQIFNKPWAPAGPTLPTAQIPPATPSNTTSTPGGDPGSLLPTIAPPFIPPAPPEPPPPPSFVENATNTRRSANLPGVSLSNQMSIVFPPQQQPYPYPIFISQLPQPSPYQNHPPANISRPSQDDPTPPPAPPRPVTPRPEPEPRPVPPPPIVPPLPITLPSIVVNICARGDPLIGADGRPSLCGSRSGGVTCPVGYFCHLGARDETTGCCRGGGSRPCMQPLAEGSGQDALARWYFDSETFRCTAFIYHGIRGNENNFLNQAECDNECGIANICPAGEPLPGPNHKPVSCAQLRCPSNYWCHVGANAAKTVCCPGALRSTEIICMMPINEGTGFESLHRWAFNHTSKQCQAFTYRGTRGNQNSYVSWEDCQRTCLPGSDVVTPPPASTPSTGPILPPVEPTTEPPPRPPQAPNPCPFGEPLQASGRAISCIFTSSVCGPSHWCHYGVDQETTVCCQGSVEAACTGLAPSEGSGNGNLHRWFFELGAKACRPFVYKGFRGNPNNFGTKEECERICPTAPAWSNPCIGEVENPVSCQPAAANSCPAGQWCHAGANRETTICCPDTAAPDQVCQQPLAIGMGNASLSRFYYNQELHTCLPFNYRGIKGNQNNYLTRKQCQENCERVRNPCSTGQPFVLSDGRYQGCNPLLASSCPPTYWCHPGDSVLTTLCCPAVSQRPCELPVSVGVGTSSMQRWHFNAGLRRCQAFQYRGLVGNQNNFVSQEACQAACHEADNPCTGQPAIVQGQVVFCTATNRDSCPVNYWCHVGARPESTLCCPGATNPCSVPLAPGTGFSNLQRWYYNNDRRECLPFVYNGIGGNQNNFQNRADCESTCPDFRI